MITKLASLSISKIGLDMVETQEIDLTLQADVLLLDDECYQQEELEQYKQANTEVKTILLYAKSTQRVEGFDAYVQKPFLPTDLVKTLSEVCGIETFVEAKGEEKVDEAEKQDSDLLDLGDLGLEVDPPKSLSPKVLDESDIEEVKQLFTEESDDENKNFEEAIDLDQKQDISAEEIQKELEVAENQQDEVELSQEDLEKSLEDLEFDKDQNEELEDLEKNNETQNTEVVETAQDEQEIDFEALLSDMQESKDEDKELVNNEVSKEAEGEFEALSLEENGSPQMQVDSIETESQESQESGESAHANIQEDSKIEDLKASEDLGEFDSLSLEAMSEALGEPIAKEPNVAPIVPKEEVKEASLPSNVQINSLESLIGALQTLQTQSLKELLSGATINISIQFPKKED